MSLGFISGKKEFTTSFNTTFSTSSSFTTTFNTSKSTTTTYNTSRSTTTTFNTSRTTSVTNQTYQQGSPNTYSYTAWRPNSAYPNRIVVYWAGINLVQNSGYYINSGGYTYYALMNNGQLRPSANYWGNYYNTAGNNNYYRWDVRRYYNVTNNYTTTFSTSRSTTTTFSTSHSTTTTFSTSKSTTTTFNTSRSTDRTTSFYA